MKTEDADSWQNHSWQYSSWKEIQGSPGGPVCRGDMSFSSALLPGLCLLCSEARGERHWVLFQQGPQWDSSLGLHLSSWLLQVSAFQIVWVSSVSLRIVLQGQRRIKPSVALWYGLCPRFCFCTGADLSDSSALNLFALWSSMTRKKRRQCSWTSHPRPLLLHLLIWNALLLPIEPSF